MVAIDPSRVSTNPQLSQTPHDTFQPQTATVQNSESATARRAQPKSESNEGTVINIHPKLGVPLTARYSWPWWQHWCNSQRSEAVWGSGSG